MKIINDLPYTDTRDRRNAYDLYLPDGGSDVLLIYFYGGSLKKGSKEKRKFPLYAAQKGLAVAVPDYRLMPEVMYPDFICDAADAVTAIIGRHGSGFGKIFVGGHSAGAYLSMMLCFDRRYLAVRGVPHGCVRGWYFISGQPTKHFSVLEADGDDPRHIVVDETSPLWYVGENEPPVLILTSDRDMPNRREQNILLRGTLEAFGNGERTVYAEIPQCLHKDFVRPDANDNIPSLSHIIDFTQKF